MRKPSITQEVYLILQEQLKPGRSKHLDKINGVDSKDKIYSYKTYENYKTNAQRFAKWAKNEKGASDLSEARKYVEEYLKIQKEKGLSAYSIKTYAMALCKIYQMELKDIDFKFEERTRKAISRSRKEVAEDKLRKGNSKVEYIARHTGMRRSELSKLKGHQVMKKDNQFFVVGVKGKGGKVRDIPILNNDLKTVELIKNAGKDKKVFTNSELKSENDIHAYRREYAQSLYEQLAKSVDEIKGEQSYNDKGVLSSRIYYCRKDAVGKSFDREAMREVSRALGHNRVEVIAKHYLI